MVSRFDCGGDYLFWLQIAELLGHSKSIFLKFRGGKGVACSFASGIASSLGLLFFSKGKIKTKQQTQSNL